MSSAVVVGASAGLSGGAVLALFAIGIVTVAVIESTKKSPEEKYRENQVSLKNSFDLMVGKIREKELSIKREHNIALDNSVKFEKYAKRVMNSFTVGASFENAMNSILKASTDEMYRVKEIESEDIKEIQYQLDSMEKIELKKEEKLIEDLQKINHLKQSSKNLMSLEDKRILVANIGGEINRYRHNLEIFEKTKELQEYVNSSSFSNLKEERVEILSSKEKLVKKIGEFKEKIRKYSENYNKFENINRYSEEKLKLVYSSVKLDFGEAKDNFIMTKIYKEDLRELRELVIDEEVLAQVDSMINQSVIKRDEYRSMANEISELIITHEKKLTIISSLKENLEELGYTLFEENSEIIEQLERGEVVYLDTEEDDYKVMLRVNNEQITTRFVRVVASDKEKDSISEYQRQRDRERAKEWCSSYDKLTNLLEKNGIEIDEKVRVEPEDENVVYVVNEKLAKKSERKEVKKEGLKKYNRMK